MKIRILSMAVLAAVLAVACQPPATPSSRSKAALTIHIGNKINSRTLAPNLDMNPASYTVTGTGPSGATFTATSTGGDVTQNNLAFGSWTVVVNATNSTGTLIGTGTAATTINTGSTASVSVTVTPVSGVGTLSLSTSWPSGSVQTPAVTATLTPALGSAQTLPFSVSGSSAGYSSSSVGNGYYTLALMVKDSGTVVAGAVDVVRIVTGATTSGTYAFSQVNAPGGAIQVNVNANMQNPLNVSISGASATQAVGTSQTLTASVSNYSDNVVYVWYVDGVSAGTGPTFAFNSGSVVGYSYRIDVTAFSADGTQAGSATTNLAVTAAPVGNQGIVTTLAGSGIAGSADGEGMLASFNRPSGVAVDSSGNIYVADSENNLIRKITPTGIVTTLAGSGSFGHADGAGTTASFVGPRSVAVDFAGNAYVNDQLNHLIRKITPTGVVTTLAGSGNVGSTNGTGAEASFGYSQGIAVDAVGNVYVADDDNHLIRKITPAGVVTTQAGTGTVGSADGLASAASFSRPYGVAADSVGNLYVADYGNHNIRKITATGIVTTLAGSGTAGSADGTGTAASFNSPTGVAVDSVGNVYVVDQFNYKIRKITPAGVVATLAGSGIAGSANGTGNAASFFNPYDVAVDSAGHLFIADYGNNLIRKIQ